MESKTGNKECRRETTSIEECGIGNDGAGSRLPFPKCYSLYQLYITSEETNYGVYIP